MNNDSLCNDIRYFQMYLKELLTDYEMNEAICDFYENDKSKFMKFGTCLGNISEALCYRQHMLCYLLFYKDKDSKSIPRLLNRIKDTKLLQNKKLDEAIKYLANEVNLLLQNANTDIVNIKEYRHNVYAHWNVNSFNKEWRKQFREKHLFDYEKIIELTRKCLETFEVILSLLDRNSYVNPKVSLGHIELLINSLKM